MLTYVKILCKPMRLWETDVRVPRGTFVNKLCKPNTRSPKRLATRHREPTKCSVYIITCSGANPTAPINLVESVLPQGFPQVYIITLLEHLFGLHNKKRGLCLFKISYFNVALLYVNSLVYNIICSTFFATV